MGHLQRLGLDRSISSQKLGAAGAEGGAEVAQTGLELPLPITS